MPNEAKKLVADLESAIEEYDSGLSDALPGAEKAAMDQIMKVISDLSTNGDSIKTTVDNLKRLRGFEARLALAIATPQFKRAVKAFIVGYATTAESINRYFVSIDPAFRAETGVFTTLLEQTQAATLESMLGAGMRQSIVKPIGDILRQNITTGGSLRQMETQLRAFLQGQPATIGALERYAKQTVFDSIQQFNRNYIEAITLDLGLVFYIYEGVQKENSRPFCKQHAGKYYHKNEIQAWVGTSWEGKIPGTTATSIFIYMGGYKCRHYLIPVSQEAVPQNVIDRNIANGNFNP